jgi:hypothetical protein
MNERTDIPQGTEFEQHFSCGQMSELWGLSPKVIRRIFCEEPGTLKLGEGETRHKRTYLTLRIPESVVRAVHKKLRQKDRVQ